MIFNAIFDVNIAKEVSKLAPILHKAYEEFEVSDSEQDLLLNLERFLLVKNEEQKFEKYIPTLLKMFYDEDLLTEEFLIDWDDGKFNPIFMMDYRFLADKDYKFKTNAKAFVNWLKYFFFLLFAKILLEAPKLSKSEVLCMYIFQQLNSRIISMHV